MNRIIISLLMSVIGAVALAADGVSIPPKLNYQGRLADSAGNPVSGSRTMIFLIYTAPTGGNAVWSETQTVVIADGLFNVILGLVTPAQVPSGPDCYLEVQVAGNDPITPRVPMVSAPYAYAAQQADNADKLDSLDASAFSRSSHAHTASGDVTGTVTGALSIAPGAVTMDKLNQAGATDGQVITWNSSAWAPRTPSSAAGIAKVIHGVVSIPRDQLSGTATFSPSINPAKSFVYLDGAFLDGNGKVWQGSFVSSLTAGGITVGLPYWPYYLNPVSIGFQIVEYE